MANTEIKANKITPFGFVTRIASSIHQQPTTITEFDETLVKRLIMKITVYEDYFTIDFKSGVIIDIEA